MMEKDALGEWVRDKPISILQLDAADRAVLKIAVVLSAMRKSLSSQLCFFAQIYLLTFCLANWPEMKRKKS
ncbi:hypothetical protein DMENIID0001_012440 [Sergentomyia squamirostris]